jgi:hypothetical protein
MRAFGLAMMVSSMITALTACAAKDVPTYKVYIGMPIAEFELVNGKANLSSVEVSTGLASIVEGHNILYQAPDGDSALLQGLGGEKAMATNLVVSNLEEKGGKYVEVPLHIDSIDVRLSGIEDFEGAHQACNAALSVLLRSGWADVSQNTYAENALREGYRSYAELLEKLPSFDEGAWFFIGEVRGGGVRASCGIVRNDYIATELGKVNSAGRAFGNDAHAKMYFAKLTFGHVE